MEKDPLLDAQTVFWLLEKYGIRIRVNDDITRVFFSGFGYEGPRSRCAFTPALPLLRQHKEVILEYVRKHGIPESICKWHY